MTAKARELGAEILLNTPAEHLIVEKGVVTGVYAKKVSNNDYIRVNAKAVIIGTGGFANNNEYLARGHFSNASKVQRFLSGFDGDGLRMVTEAGGTDTLDRFSGLFQLTVSGAPGGEYGTFGSGNGLVVGSHSGNTIWVNEYGERFCAENSGDENWMALMIPTLVHQRSYSIFDRATFEANVRNIAFPADSFEESMAEIDERFASNPYNDAFTADTIEALAVKVAAAFPDIKAETLVQTFNSYNALCRSGEDIDFGKPAKYLVELKNPPYYFIYMPQAVMVTFGGIHVNRKFECVDAGEKPIPGLYSIGVDSAELWPNIYTINVPGGTNANNVNSGRSAANNARTYIGSARTGRVSSSGDTSPSVVVGKWTNPTGIKDGTYTATARGMFGDITVTLAVSGGKISGIAQTNELETPYIGVLALNELISAVIVAQDVNVDTVSGATQTSNGFRNAVADCLKQAAK
jgi:fumarate reductase flavoprotein subunit